MNEQAKRSRKLKRYWKQKLAEWQESDLSGQAWCKKEKHSYYQFNYWKGALSMGKSSLPRSGSSDAFIELVGEQSKKTPGIRIELGIVTIQLDQDFDEEALKKVLRLVQESSSC